MTIEVTIPQSILNTCRECGWNELEAAEYFNKYLTEVINHPYGQFEQDFGLWLEDLEEES